MIYLGDLLSGIANYMKQDLEISGERVAVGKAEPRNEEDHVDRYNYVAPFANGKRVLDVACGTGFGTQILAQAGAATVHGVDIDAPAIEYAKQNHQEASVTYVVGSAGELPFSENSFEQIVSFETIEHLPDDVRSDYLDEMSRVLVAEGTLYISTPNKRITTPWKETPNNPFHVLEYTESALMAELEEHGFRPVKKWGQRMVPTPLTWWGPRRLVRVVEKLFGLNFKLYTVANGRSVQSVPAWHQPRYFVWECKKQLDK